jgi:glycine hydroxymethyltransferase
MEAIADVVHQVVTNIHPFAYQGLAGELPRGKIDLEILEGAKRDVAALAEKAGIDFSVPKSGYPHFFIKGGNGRSRMLEISGWRARAFMQEISTNNLTALEPGESTRSFLLDGEGKLIDDVAVTRLEQDEHGRDRYRMEVRDQAREQVTAWLRGLADGYILFDDEDVFRKVQGPVVVEEVDEPNPAGLEAVAEAVAEPGTTGQTLLEQYPERFDLTLPYFVGQNRLDGQTSIGAKEEWMWTEPEDEPTKQTALFETHKEMGGRMVPFAGWEMPVWYTSVSEEHAAVRGVAGLFDVSHMGCFEVAGDNAIPFLDTVLSNYAHWLNDGESCYAYLLDPDGMPIDDLMIYRRRADLFLMVVNAANEDKDWDWLNAVNERRVIIDHDRPWLEVEAPATLRNLKDPASGERQLRDLALQGPNSLAILQACTDDPAVKGALARVRRTDLIEVELSGIPIVAARTGYTGEDMGFELFVHPDQQLAFWNLLLEKGEAYDIKPCGLGARDSTRTEAGLPLYGHELAGPLEIDPIEAGFPGYVKYHKPFFIGRDPLLARDLERTREVIRWRMDQKGVRRPNIGDPVVNRRGQVVGYVTSCSIDVEGYLIGLAIVNRRYTEPGTSIGIFVLPTKVQKEKQKPDLEMGDKVLLPVEATVLTRFPERETKSPLPAGD